jgi:hypothetical protein
MRAACACVGGLLPRRQAQRPLQGFQLHILRISGPFLLLESIRSARTHMKRMHTTRGTHSYDAEFVRLTYTANRRNNTESEKHANVQTAEPQAA